MNPEQARELFNFLHKAAEYDITRFGRGGIGVALMTRWLDPDSDGYVPVSDLAGELTLSSAQIRRRLHRLVDTADAERVEREGVHCFRITDEAAQKFIDYLEKQLAETGF